MPSVPAIGSVRAAALAWRLAAEPRLTLAIKATYELTSAGSLVLVQPLPFVPSDEAIAFTGELAPFKARVDVVFSGSVRLPGKQIGARARLAVLRHGRPVLDRRLLVYGERGSDGSFAPIDQWPILFRWALGGPGDDRNVEGSPHPIVIDEAHPERPGCLSAIPPSWPARAAQLAGSRLAREGAILALSEPFAWGYFQEAPPEQQLAQIEPNDVLVLQHLTDRAPSLTIPCSPVAPRVTLTDTPLPLRLDTLRIDGDTGHVSFVWRGVRALEASESADALLATARVEYETALAALSTGGVDASKLDMPIAPFLQRSKEVPSPPVPPAVTEPARSAPPMPPPPPPPAAPEAKPLVAAPPKGGERARVVERLRRAGASAAVLERLAGGPRRAT